jgi:hypothetical protein
MIFKIIVVMANKKQKMANKQNKTKKTMERKTLNPTKITLNCYFQIETKIGFLIKTQFGSSKNHKLELDHMFKTFKNQRSIPTLVLEFYGNLLVLVLLSSQN